VDDTPLSGRTQLRIQRSLVGTCLKSKPSIDQPPKVNLVATRSGVQLPVPLDSENNFNASSLDAPDLRSLVY